MSDKKKYITVNAVIDLETTGLLPGKNEIIEVGIVIYDPKTMCPTSQVFKRMIKPQHPENIDPKAMELNQIDLDAIPHWATPEAVMKDLLNWISEQGTGKIKLMPLGHHYGSFDLLFLKEWLTPQIYNDNFHYRVGDTSAMARLLKDAHILPLKSCSLKVLCEYYGIEIPPHSAVEDALATLKVYAKLLKELHPAVCFARGIKYYLNMFPDWIANVWRQAFTGGQEW